MFKKLIALTFLLLSGIASAEEKTIPFIVNEQPQLKETSMNLNDVYELKSGFVDGQNGTPVPVMYKEPVKNVPEINDGDTNAFFKYGLGVFNSAKNSRAETKMVSFGHQDPIFGCMIRQWEVGGWMDSRSDLGRKSSGFADAAIGVNIDVSRFYAQSLWGVGVITTRDSMLGGNFQFNQDLGVGLKDERGMSIGINYKHMSSAGIFQPNVGRDFGAIKLSIPW